MRKDSPELPADIQRLLDAERAAPPPVEPVNRIEAKIARRLREPFDPGGLPLRVRLRTLLALFPGWTLPVVALALGASMGIGVRSVLTLGRGATSGQARPEATSVPAAPPAPIPEPPPVAPPAAAPAALPPSALQGPAATGKKAPPAASARPGFEDSLDRERALIERARTALYRGANETALGYLDECARSFPRGQLAEEREALWIQSAMGAAKYDAARERGRAFARQYPNSFLLPAIEEVLKGASD
jgi:hypothetical protein